MDEGRACQSANQLCWMVFGNSLPKVEMEETLVEEVVRRPYLES